MCENKTYYLHFFFTWTQKLRRKVSLRYYGAFGLGVVPLRYYGAFGLGVVCPYVISARLDWA
jgi:hypothetical protein